MNARHPVLLRDWLRFAVNRLQAAGVPSAEVDARALILHTLKLPSTAFLLRGDQPVTAHDAAWLLHLLDQRAARVPLQHLLGEIEWGGVHLRVDARALIPRPETEWLLHLALSALNGLTAPRVADIGTGSGALALAVKKQRPDAQVTASDLSPEALSLARENAQLNGLDITFMQTDLLRGLSGPFHLILSNPPYLPDADQDNAQPEVTHDPPQALYAGPDGLSVARHLTTQARTALHPGGTLLLELDPRNAPTLSAELQAQGWSAELHADLTGRMRFVKATPA